jgi:hypothetical protein
MSTYMDKDHEQSCRQSNARDYSVDCWEEVQEKDIRENGGSTDTYFPAHDEKGRERNRAKVKSDADEPPATVIGTDKFPSRQRLAT